MSNTPSNYSLNPIKIYLRHTSATATNTSYPGNTDFQEVYNGPFVWNGSGWHYFIFDNPFVWDGESNIEFLIENHNGSSYVSGYPSFYSHSTSPIQLTTYKYATASFPTTTGSNTYTRPNIQIITPMTTPPNPTTLAAPADGVSYVNTSVQLQWNANLGTDGYKLHLGTDATPAFVADLGNQTYYNTVDLQPSTQYYWQVIPYNQHGDATDCPVWGFETSPAGLISIGDGNATGSYLPINNLYNYSYSQSIYLQSEINMASQRIEKLYYYWNALGSGVNNDEWTIYIGHTDAGTYESIIDWVPNSELTQVFSGNVSFPTTAGWMEIPLAVPFVYNNSQNLVIAVLESSDGLTSGGSFLSTVAASRSLRYYNNILLPDLENLPGGTRQGHYPNIMMQFGDLPSDPVFSYNPQTIDFGLMMQNRPSDWKNLMITNSGSGVISLNESDFNIVGSDAAMFEYNAINLPVNLGPGQNLRLPLRATLTEEGELSATLQISWQSELFEVALLAEGRHAGTVLIGDGVSTSRFPLGSYYGYERNAALYTADEIGSGNKRINAVSWYATTAVNVAVRTKIYLKEYAGDTIVSDNWANHIAGSILVYDATPGNIIANEWNTFELENTFDLDNGRNLMVLVERNYGGYGNGTTAGAGIRGTTMDDMHHFLQDHNTPPSGTSNASGTRPNLMFFSNSYEISTSPNPAIAISPANGADMLPLDLELQWARGGGAPEGFKLYFGNSNPPAFVADLGNVLSYQPEDLVNETIYYWQVVPYNAFGEAEDCPIWSFETLPAGIVTIGEGTEYVEFPFFSLYPAARTQMLFTVDELIAAGALPGSTINSIAYDVIYRWDAVLDDLMIRMKHTDSQNLIAFEEGDFETCFQANHGIQSLGWNYFDFEDGFFWNGTQNLLIDVSFSYDDWGDNTALNGSEAYGKIWVTYEGSGPGYNLTGGYDEYARPNTRFIMSVPSEDPVLAPILVSPVNGATGLPVGGFDLVWTPNLSEGGLPDYYTVYLSQDETDIFGDQYFEIDDASINRFNPVVDGGMSFGYNERWYWTVTAANSYGESDSEDQIIFRFDIQDNPTITEFPWYEGFEDYDDFALNFLPWSQYDGDGMTTWSIDSYLFPNQNYTGSYIIFNPSATTPALPTSWAAHGGNKYAAAFDANGAANNDWLISPPIQSSAPLSFSFWARSITDSYGLERFNVLVSTTDTNPASFTKINTGSYIEAPVDWTRYHYFLDYPGETIYLAIQCVSNDAFAFFVDDVEISLTPNIDLAVNGFNADPAAWVNSPAAFEVTVENVGLSPQSAYNVYIKNSANAEILAQLSVNESLVHGASAVHQLSWTPAITGTYNVYAEVSASGDTNPDNDTSSPASIIVYSETMNLLHVGDPESTSGSSTFPFNFYYEDFVAETIYLASEMQVYGGNIEALQYTCSFPADDSSEFQIWMKNTDVNSLSSGWLPFDGYTLVYNGVISSPAGYHQVLIPITPFAYTGGNLAIRTSRTWDGSWASNRLWLVTADTNYTSRTRYYQADSSELNHINPSGGGNSNLVPNVTFFMNSDQLVSTLATPAAQISKTGAQMKLEWDLVDYAHSYRLYKATDTVSFEEEPFAIVYGNSYSFTPNAAAQASFYKVSAASYRDFARLSFAQRPANTEALSSVDETPQTKILLQRTSR